MAAKVPYPRPLTATETLDTLTHWKCHVRNYFRRDDNLKGFFAREQTWDPALDNYGFQGDDAMLKADSLEGLLDTISGFMPGPYLTARITTQTKSMNDVFDIIWQHYDVQPNPATYLDFANLTLQQSERYIDLYYRMLYHAEMHLLKAGTEVDGKALTANEKMSASHKNLIVLNWIQTISPSLLSIVKLEKHKELKDGKQLCEMVNEISKNVDDWLKRHGGKMPLRLQDAKAVQEQNELTVRNLRLDGQPDQTTRGAWRGQSRGGAYRGGRGGYRNNFSRNRAPASGNQNYDARKFCPGCKFLATELQLDVNFRHYPADCTRKRSVLRLLNSAEEELDAAEQEDLQDEHADQADQPQEDFNVYEGYDQKLFTTIKSGPSHVYPSCQNADKSEPPVIQSKDGLCKDLTYPSFVNKVWKAQSPTVHVILNNKSVKAIVDEGSEVSAIDANVANDLNVPISRTIEAAQSAGSQNLNIVGETTNDVIVFVYVNNTVVRWNLGQCLIVERLGCDILIGEPAKACNHIQTDPVMKCLSTLDIHKNKTVLSYTLPRISSNPVSDKMGLETPRQTSHNPESVRLTESQNIYPGDSLYVNVPKSLKAESEILLEHTGANAFPAPGIYTVNHGLIKCENVGPHIFRVSDQHILYFSSLRKLKSVEKKFVATEPDSKIPKQNMRKIYDINKENLRQYEYPNRLNDYPETSTLHKVSIDPDNKLSPRHKAMFEDIIYNNQDIISDIPGRYNGFYGNVNCSMTLSGNPPPSIKPRIPSYSTEKLNILANLLDEMEEWGVLVKPETIGVIPTHIHPCILVPKDNDKYRLVTDFKSIQSHIMPLPAVMPTVSEAMTALAAADYHVELDFSNYYWQNPIPREDSAKLAIAHPYGGLRVYTVCPQGLRNSAEWGSEILSRIYGDMVKKGRCTRIADQIYVLGNSVIELAENFKEILARARNANLTFKASKIIVCPHSTVILGWKKQGSLWLPTQHVLSPLSAAEPPATVKKMRGWLGAFRQISKTIPNHAVVLQPFEKLVGGKNSKDKIQWSPQLLKEFDVAKKSIQTVRPITIPRPSDHLRIFPDWSQDADAVGGRLIIERLVNGKNIELHGGQFSARLKGAQSRWTPCEKECLAIKLLVQHFQPFIRENKNKTTVLTDNIVSVHAWNAIKLGKVSSSSRVASFISTMCENNIDIQHYPGTSTKVADFNSRNPMSCTQPKCQTCSFIAQEIRYHESYIRFNQTDNPNVLLTTRSTWLDLQKNDSTLAQLFRLIKTGLAPEKKCRNKNLKLLHNLYKRGIIFISSDGLIQHKSADIVHNLTYEAIVVPDIYISSIIQSLHIKLNHPSAYQLHKTLSRYYFAIGIAKIVNNISSSCDVCTRLKTLPKEAQMSTTSKNTSFGSHFSADVLIEKGQRILLCREKLSQFTTTVFLQDETKECLEEGLICSILTFVPETGAVVQVDPGPGLVALSTDNNNILSGYNIQLDIGRSHNKQKNPIAENAIKEFRKEWLRLKPSGSILSDKERAIITDTMNKRIRLNGLASKEMLMKRSLYNHSSVQVVDEKEGESQFDRRQLANQKQFLRDSATKSLPTQQTFKKGDIVLIKADLSKSRARERHIVTSCFMKENIQWLLIKKCQSGFRNKNYLVKASEVYLASNLGTSHDIESDDDDFVGFHENVTLNKRDKIKKIIESMSNSLPKERSRGRPKRPAYPDYLKPLPEDIQVDHNDEILVGFHENDYAEQLSMKEKIHNVLHELESHVDANESESFYGFSQTEIDNAKKAKQKVDNVVCEYDNETSKISMVSNFPIKQALATHAWNYDEWMHILEHDDDHDIKIIRHNLRVYSNSQVEGDDLQQMREVDDNDHDHMSLEEDDLFMSAHSPNDQSATFMYNQDVSTVEDFDIHFERFQSHASTPKKQQHVSETDPLVVDRIPVVSTSSESSLGLPDGRLFPDDDEVTALPEGQVQLSQALEDIHANHPELAEPLQGRVYNMDQILTNIERYKLDHSTDTQEDSASVARSRPRRNLQRANYKQLHEGAIPRRK